MPCMIRIGQPQGVIPALISVLLAAVPSASFGMTAEQVLGEYWKDPLFGRAASSHEVSLELLYKRIWPERVEVPPEETVRFVVKNQGDEVHILLFSRERDPRTSDDEFQEFIRDDLHHATQAVNSSHHHHSSGSSVEETVDIVKVVDQRPTLLIMPGEQKEMLLRFPEPGMYHAFCVLDAHWDEGYTMRIHVEMTESGEQ